MGAAIVGVMAGIATSMLKHMIAWIGLLISKCIRPSGFNWEIMLFPLLGVMLAIFFQKKIVKEDLAHGTKLIKARMLSGNYYFPDNLMWNPLLACWMTVGFGGSAGAEGPSAYSGGAIGSCVARWLGISSDGMRILVGCGAGAGIAGIFKAPVGGVLFTLEVLNMPMVTVAVMSLVVACLCSFATSYVISGFHWNTSFTAAVPFDPHHLVWFMILGVFCGLYCIYYNHTRHVTAKALGKISSVWVKGLSSGLWLAIMVFLFPALFGEGYQIMTGMINHDDSTLFVYSPFFRESGGYVWTVVLIAAILLIKGVAVAAANYGGGVAGEFAPTLFAGSLAGYLFAIVANHLFGVGLPPGTFALVGMAGVMAGSVGAPLMSIFIAAECTASYTFLLAFMFTAAISYIVVVSFETLTSQHSVAPLHKV